MDSIRNAFAIILAIALLSYVIVVILGTLSDSTIIDDATLSATEVNESGWINQSGYTLAKSLTVSGFTSASITQITNGTAPWNVIPATNYTLASNVIKNASFDSITNDVDITYTYKYDTGYRKDSVTILSNVSGGVASFFVSINPVYAILAVLVIILILVVLVRVVTGSGAPRGTSPQL